jgi:hypothetical protein
MVLYHNTCSSSYDTYDVIRRGTKKKLEEQKSIWFYITTHVSSSSYDTYDVIRRGTKRVSQHIVRETHCEKRPTICGPKFCITTNRRNYTRSSLNSQKRTLYDISSNFQCIGNIIHINVND